MKLEEIIEHCSDKQRKLIDEWPLDNLPARSKRAFLASVEEAFENYTKSHAYRYDVEECFQRKRRTITKFLKDTREGLEKLELFDDEATHKIIQLYVPEDKHYLEGKGRELQYITRRLEQFSKVGVDLSRIFDLQIKNRRNSSSINLYDIEEVVHEGSIERAEYARKTLDKFKRRGQYRDEERNLFSTVNGITDAGMDFEEFCDFYLNFAQSLSKRENKWWIPGKFHTNKRYMLNDLAEHAPEIVKAGGMDLLKESTTGINWMLSKGYSSWWFSGVPEFHKAGNLDQKREFLRELSRKPSEVAYRLWNAKVPKKLQPIEDEIKTFVSYEKTGRYGGAWHNRPVIPALEKACSYLKKKKDPQAALDALIKFREENKYKTSGLTPSRTVGVFQFYDLLGGELDELKVAVRDSTKLLVELPEIYDKLAKHIPKKEALEAVKYLRENYVKTTEVSSSSLADLVLFYQGQDWDLNLIGRSMEALGRHTFDLPGIYGKLEDSVLQPHAKTFINHLRKKRSRTLITQARDVVHHRAFTDLAKRLPDQIGKKDFVDVVRAYATSASSAKVHYVDDRFANKIKRMQYGLSVDQITSQLSVQSLIAAKYREFAGTSVIPREHRKVVDQCMATRSLSKDKYGVLSALVTNYLGNGAAATQQALLRFERNAELFLEDEERIAQFRMIPTRTYEVTREGKMTLRDVINAELRQIQDVLKPLGMKIRSVSDINMDKVPEEHYEEVELHISNIKNAEFRNKDISEVTFYFGKDLMENLQMGNFFGSCLSIDRFNFEYALHHCVDANKGVIYGKNQKGNIIARNRVALADEGILLTRFYNQDRIDEQWKSYLQEVANATGEVVFVSDHRLGKKTKKATLTVQNAHFSGLYSDGLFSVKENEGVSKASGDFYQIFPEKQADEKMPEIPIATLIDSSRPSDSLRIS